MRALQSVHQVDKHKKQCHRSLSRHRLHAPDLDQDDPMVITMEIARYDVSKVLIDHGSSINILY